MARRLLSLHNIVIALFILFVMLTAFIEVRYAMPIMQNDPLPDINTPMFALLEAVSIMPLWVKFVFYPVGVLLYALTGWLMMNGEV